MRNLLEQFLQRRAFYSWSLINHWAGKWRYNTCSFEKYFCSKIKQQSFSWKVVSMAPSSICNVFSSDRRLFSLLLFEAKFRLVSILSLRSSSHHIHIKWWCEVMNDCLLANYMTSIDHWLLVLIYLSTERLGTAMYYEWLCLGCLLGAELYLGIALYLMVLHWYCLITSMFKWSWMIVPGVFVGGRLRGVAANGLTALPSLYFDSYHCRQRWEKKSKSPIHQLPNSKSPTQQFTKSPGHQFTSMGRKDPNNYYSDAETRGLVH